MNDRVVNLSEKPRAVVELQLAGRSFRIARVVNAARALYGDVLKEASVLIGKTQAVAAKEDEMFAAPESERPRLTREIQAIVEEVEHFAARKNEALMTCIKLILEANGYSFDLQWWQEHGDEMDYQSFIVEALMKDSPTQKKTVEVAV